MLHTDEKGFQKQKQKKKTETEAFQSRLLEPILNLGAATAVGGSQDPAAIAALPVERCLCSVATCL